MCDGLDIEEQMEALQQQAINARTARPEISTSLSTIEAGLHRRFTEEQKDFICDMEHDMISNSDAGSGKTTAAIAKLILMELDRVVDMSKVYAMSFTKAATGELKYRYEDAIKELGMGYRNKIHFETMHVICNKLIYKYYHLLGMKSYHGVDKMEYSQVTKFLLDFGEEKGIPINKYNVRKVKKAIESLNASLIFDPAHIATKKAFKDCKLTIEQLTLAREELYRLNRAVSKIQVGDLLLYTLELLLTHPEIVEEEKEAHKIVICDESQDLSLLQLKLLDTISDKLIMIGDINQQIYAFNGACPQIVEEFKKARPGYTVRNLTQSFRFGEEIAEYAKRIVRPNGTAAEDLKGLKDKESDVIVSNQIQLSDVCDKIRDELDHNGGLFVNSYMFLYRNNFSILPLYELLYKLKIPAQSDKFVEAYKIDIISDIIDIIKVAEDPKDVKRFWIFKKLLPEFATYKDLNKLPLTLIVKQTGLSVLEVAYQFKDERAGGLLMETIMDVREMLLKEAPITDIFNRIWKVYDAIYYKHNAYKYEQDAEFYINLIKPLLVGKTYQEFMDMENDKARYVAEWNERRMGVRCYTMHSSKGTEADFVYILDANVGLIPNEKRLEEAINSECIVDAAEVVRNERSLVFVGITRARKATYILYNGEISPIAVGDNPYAELDRAYKIYNQDYNDVEYFRRFIEEVNDETGCD